MTQETTPQAPQAASEQEQQSNDTSSQSTMPLQQPSNVSSQSVMPLQLSPDEQTPVLQERMQQLRLCVVIPTYNNQNTVADVIRDVLRYTSNVIVVNDGSTDRTAEILSGLSAVPNSDMPSVPSLSAEVPSEHRIPLHPTVVSYQPNRGKGYALKRGFDKAEELGFEGAITIDSDGQHFASEIERFVGYAEQNPGALLLGQRTSEGDMPAKNSFANKFSNFWFTVQTAYRLNDTQNGFRLYPLAAMKGLRSVSSRYEAELEMLVRAAWKGIRIIPVPTRVYYPPEGERVTHFRPGKDFFRISVLNTLFTLLAIVYGYPSMFFHKLFAKKKKS